MRKRIYSVSEIAGSLAEGLNLANLAEKTSVSETKQSNSTSEILTRADQNGAAKKATRIVFHQTKNATYALWIARPGEEIAAHVHKNGEDAWICLQGEAEFYPSKNERVRIKAGDVVISAEGECHGAINTGALDFIFISVLTPADAVYKAL